MNEFLVPAGSGESELTEKRSRFLGHLRKVQSEEEAKAFISEAKKTWHDARHNCWCYLLPGEVRYSEEFEIALVRTKDSTAKLFGGGQVSVTSKTLEGARTMFERAVKALLRAQMCTSCGICAKKCSRHAITVKDGLHVDAVRCISCGRCEGSCMVAHYYDKVL